AQSRRDENPHLGPGGEAAPELVEEEENARGERQGAEEGGDAHAERELLRLRVAVDVEGAREGREQVALVLGHRATLVLAERQHPLALQAVELAPEEPHLVGALLGLGSGGRGHAPILAHRALEYGGALIYHRAISAPNDVPCRQPKIPWSRS